MFDTNKVITEADIYVRDHLLIQWMIDYYMPIAHKQKGKEDFEDIYECWIAWLNIKEDMHAKRSEV